MERNMVTGLTAQLLIVSNENLTFAIYKHLHFSLYEHLWDSMNKLAFPLLPPSVKFDSFRIALDISFVFQLPLLNDSSA